MFMQLENIEIKGLRGFKENSSIKLAIPNGNFGSGLTVIVGPNNSGKSTIVEAFSAISIAMSPTISPGQIFNGPSFTEEMRNKKEDSILIRAKDISDNFLEISSNSILKSETSVRNTIPRLITEDLYVLRSRRYFEPYNDIENNQIYSRESYLQKINLPSHRGSIMPLFFNRILLIQRNRKNFDDVMKTILDPLPEWKIDRDGSGKYYMQFNYHGMIHVSDGLGDGLLSIFFIVDALYDSSPNTAIVIDEPELSLHPSLQKKLLELFGEYAKDRQIILATHSPYFIDWNSIANGAKISRVVKEDGVSKIYQLSDESTDELNGLLHDLNNPHVLGLNANEAFFLDDRIVLVEGQEDVIFYKKIMEQLNLKLKGDFFGWGVGGYGKMRVIARILHDLGFKKVVGILDGGRESDIDDLKRIFPEYKFFGIPTGDVRTKPPRKAKEKVLGLVDEKGNLRAEHEASMKKLFERINSELRTDES